jgi:TolB-like protein
MKKHFIIFLLVGIVLAQKTAVTVKENDSDNKFIAVFDLENNGLRDNEIRTIRNRLESEIKKTGLKVVEREQINELHKEQKLQLSGAVEHSLVNIGALLGATHVLSGSVGKMSDTYYTISAKLVDVSSGELIKTADYDAMKGLSDLIKNGTRIIASSLFEIQVETNLEEQSHYTVMVGNIFISDKDFHISFFGNPLNIGLTIWENQNQIEKINIGKVRGLNGINKKIKLKPKPNSVYKLYIGETDGELTSNSLYEWVSTWKGGKVEQRTVDWFFDQNKLKFGSNSYIEMMQEPRYTDLKAELFDDSNFEGISLPLGDNISKLKNKKFKERGQNRNWNDILSSIKIEKGSRIILFEHSNYEGDSLIVTTGKANLKNIGWNDRASSLKVFQE